MCTYCSIDSRIFIFVLLFRFRALRPALTLKSSDLKSQTFRQTFAATGERREEERARSPVRTNSTTAPHVPHVAGGRVASTAGTTGITRIRGGSESEESETSVNGDRDPQQTVDSRGRRSVRRAWQGRHRRCRGETLRGLCMRGSTSTRPHLALAEGRRDLRAFAHDADDDAGEAAHPNGGGDRRGVGKRGREYLTRQRGGPCGQRTAPVTRLAPAHMRRRGREERSKDGS